MQLGLVAGRDRHGLTGPGVGVFGRRQHKLVVRKADRGPGRALVRPPYGVGHVRRGDRAGGRRGHGELVRVRHRDGVEPAQRAAGREVAVDHIAGGQAVAGAVDGHDGQRPGVGGAHTVEVAIRDRASVVDILDERVIAPDPHAGGRQLDEACRRGVEDERQEPARQIVVGRAQILETWAHRNRAEDGRDEIDHALGGEPHFLQIDAGQSRFTDLTRVEREEWNLCSCHKINTPKAGRGRGSWRIHASSGPMSRA